MVPRRDAPIVSIFSFLENVSPTYDTLRRRRLAMANLMVLVWQNKEPTGEPDVEVKVPATMAKWVPKLMKFVPKKTREEQWGRDIDFDALFADLENVIREATEKGEAELMSVKTHDSYVKILVQK